MEEKGSLIVGIGRMQLHFRHARSLKDKRHSLKGILNKLRNNGFSVTECGYADNAKRATIGYVIAGHSGGEIEQRLRDAEDLFFGDMEVLQKDRDIIDYGFEKDEQFGGWEHEDGIY